MRWMKHLTRAHLDESVTPILAEGGPEAYGVYWLLCEIVGETIGRGDVAEVTHPLAFWRANLHMNLQKTSRILALLSNFGLICYELSETSLKVSIPKLLKYKDEYASRVGTVSGQCRDVVPIKERETDIDKKNPLPPAGDAARKRAAGDAWAADQKFIALFDRFWILYPNRVEKHRAKSALWKHWRAERKSDAWGEKFILSLEMRLEGLKHQHQRGFCQHPATWINGRPWDEDNLPFVPGLEPEKKIHRLII